MEDTVTASVTGLTILGSTCAKADPRTIFGKR